ncbi:MAG: hypothetical protein R3336_08010 [Phycisphaeraceae bacterium]|nr:hypothetical protein [Phycisphaeraceae bacterium]
MGILLPGLLLALVVGPIERVRGNTWSSKKWQVQLEVPSDWHLIPDGVLKEAQRQSPRLGTYLTGYQASAPPGLSRPYVLVEVIPYERLNLEGPPAPELLPEIVKLLGDPERGRPVQSHHAETGSLSPPMPAERGQMASSPVRIDEAGENFRWEEAIRPVADVPVRGLIEGRFGAEGIVTVCFYATASQWEELAELREQIVGSLAFEQSATYNQTLAGIGDQAAWLRVIGYGLLGLLAGGSVGLILLIAAWRQRQKPDWQ